MSAPAPTSPTSSSSRSPSFQAPAFLRRTNTSSSQDSPSNSSASLATDVTPVPSRPEVPAHVGSTYRRTSTAPSTSATHSPTTTHQDEPAGGIMEHPDVVLSMDACRYHAVARCPKDPFARPRWEMSNIHCALFNGLECVYQHAPHVSGLEARLAFTHFASSVVHAIDFHHDVEEEYYFPSLEVAISMQQNLEQHASFDDGVRALKFYLKSVIVDPTIYDGSTIVAIIDMFARDLACHFADELNTLDPDVLRNHFTTKDLDRQGASLQKEILKEYKRHLYTALPVLIINTPPTHRWPVLSPVVRRLVVPLVLGRKFKASWSYSRWPGQLKVFGSGAGEPVSSARGVSTEEGKKAAGSVKGVETVSTT